MWLAMRARSSSDMRFVRVRWFGMNLVHTSELFMTFSAAAAAAAAAIRSYDDRRRRSSAPAVNLALSSI